MSVNKILSVSIAAISLATFSFNQQAVGKSKSAKHIKASAATAKPAADDEAAIRARLTELNEYLKKGDTKSLAGLWTIDGDFTDSDGDVYRGYSELKDNFDNARKEEDNPKIEIVGEQIRLPAKNVAIVEGTVSLKSDDNKSEPTSRFTMTWVKVADTWLISTATDTKIVPAAITDMNPLSALDWLVGNWTSSSKDGTVSLRAQWIPTKQFIVCQFDIKKPDQANQRGIQIIGWDPRNQAPISWAFDSSGGFGQGHWLQQGDLWTVDSTGIERNGSQTSATNIYTPGQAGFTWQSVNRHVAGLPVPDTVPIAVTPSKHTLDLGPGIESKLK